VFSGVTLGGLDIFVFKNSKVAADGHLGYTKVALQPACRTVACLSLRQLGFLVCHHTECSRANCVMTIGHLVAGVV